MQCADKKGDSSREISFNHRKILLPVCGIIWVIATSQLLNLSLLSMLFILVVISKNSVRLLPVWEVPKSFTKETKNVLKILVYSNLPGKQINLNIPQFLYLLFISHFILKRNWRILHISCVGNNRIYMLFTHLNVLKMFTVGFGVQSNSSTGCKTQENVKYIFILTQKD